ncbi:Hypothetical predicted protein [Octopus vulgaris]|uniref:Uncharacterized protein n=1 Tax=Octopus vulgaris TaxID=6645 RepID=A0AA36AZC8_OCTVU|nr:Hypothetical predicted protein [Octopus vulgaris]
MRRSMISKLINYAKSLSCGSVREADIGEMQTTDRDAPVVCLLSDGKIAEMVLNTDKNKESSGDYIEDTGERILMEHMEKICDQLIAGLEQHAFISDPQIVGVYSIIETLLGQKPMLRQMTLEEVFKNAPLS